MSDFGNQMGAQGGSGGAYASQQPAEQGLALPGFSWRHADPSVYDSYLIKLEENLHWWLVTLGAILLGVITNIVYDTIKYGGIRIPRVLDRRALSAVATRHDIRDEGLYPIVTWLRQRLLTPDRLVTRYVKRPRRTHILEVPEWQRAVRSFRGRGAAGRTAYITSLEVDTGEHERANQCHISIAESSYAECLASKDVVNNNPKLAERIQNLIEEGGFSLIRSGPPTMVSACIAIISRTNRTLLLRRSLSVTTYPGQWTVGINESMKYSDEPGAEEDFFALVRRGLDEELGLKPSDYGEIVITWFGWSQDAACYVIVAAVRLKVTERDVESKRQACHSVYEHDLAQWIPLRSRDISKIITSAKMPMLERTWSYLAPLVAAEIWRCQHYT